MRIANGVWRVRLNVRLADVFAPNGSTTSTWATTPSTAMSGAVHTTEVAPAAASSSGVVTLPIVTFAQTRRSAFAKMSSDIVHANVTADAAWNVSPSVGDWIVRVGGWFAGKPGSIAREKSCGEFESVQAASRSRIRPTRGAGASPRIVFPGSHVSVPPLVALNSTRSTTMSPPPAVAPAPPGLRYTSFSASPVGIRLRGKDRFTRSGDCAGIVPVSERDGPW